MAIECTQCGRLLEATASFCDMCGTPLRAAPAGWATCPGCQTPVPAGQAFCNNCGTAVEQGPAQPTADAGEPTMVEPEPAAAAAGFCPGCGNELPAAATFCNMCGAQLGTPASGSQHDTQAYGDPIPVVEDEASLPVPDPGPPALPARLVLQGSNATIALPAGQQQLIVGREDPAGGIFPAIDLEPYGGDEGGVSRRHAQIIRQGDDYYLEDLESMNHTFVNRKKLAAGDRHLLAEGDTIRFGAIVTTFHGATR